MIESYISAASSLIKAILSLALDNLLSVAYILLLLLLLTIPLGSAILLLFKKTFSSFYEFVIHSFVVGIAVFSLISYINVRFFHFSLYIDIIIIAILSLFIWFLVIQKSLHRELSMTFEAGSKSKKKQKLRFILYLGIIIIFLYYMYTPLTSYYTFARDYDLFAVGIEQKAKLELPFYDIENYYPPLVSLISAHFLLLSNINANKIMEIIFFFIAFLNPLVIYYLGERIGKTNGLIFLLSYLLLASPKNHVGGGSSYPAILGIFFSITFFIFLMDLYKEGNRCKNAFSFYMAALLLPLVALSHFDIFFPTLFGFSSFILALLINKEWNIIKKLLILGAISFIILSPFILRELQGYNDLKSSWGEKDIKEKNIGESHPISLSELLFFQGKVFVPFFIFGIVALIAWFFDKKIKEPKTICTFLLFWLVTFLLQNNTFFLNFITRFIHIYPLNIIMWSGTSILLSMLCSIGIIYLIERFKGMKNTIIIILILIVIFSFIDFETINLQKSYRPMNSGNIKKGIVNRQTDFGVGDNMCLNYARNLDGELIIGKYSYASMMIPVYTKKEAYPFFYDVSYVSDSYKSEFIKRKVCYELYLQIKNDSCIKENNLIKPDYIFMPSVFDYDTINTGNWQFLGNKIVCRSDGAKLISLKETSNTVYHYEIEKLINLSPNKYYYGASNDFTTLTIKDNHLINLTDEWSGNVRIHIKYLSSPFFEKFNIKTDGKDHYFGKRSRKIEMTEDYININDFDGSFEIIPRKGIISLEIDWIEVEEIKTK